MGIPGPSIGAGLRERANRKEYWLIVGTLVAVSLLLVRTAPVVSLASAGVVLYAQMRRLHDFGWSGWWAGALLLLQIPLAFALFYTLGEDTTLLVGDGLVLIPIIVIGLVPGHPHANRFGPPPGQRPLKDVFS